RADAEHGDRLAEAEFSHVDGVQRGDQSAAATDERLRRQLLWNLDHLHAGLHPDRLGPTAEQTVVRAVGDLVHFAMRAPRRLARDETVVAVVAGLMDVEEGDDIAFLDRAAIDVSELPARLFDDANRDVPRDDRKWDVELSVVKMDVRPAHLGV